MRALRFAITCSFFALALMAAPACGPDPVPVAGDDVCHEEQGRVYTVADGGQTYYAVIPDAGSAD